MEACRGHDSPRPPRALDDSPAIAKSFAGVHALVDGALELARRRSHGADRRERRRQVDAGQDPHRPLRARRRHDPHRRRAGAPALDAGRHAASASPRSIRKRPCSTIFPSPRTSSCRTRPLTRFGLSTGGDERPRPGALAELEADLDPTTPLRSLSIAQKHLVQIARALSHRGARRHHGRADRRPLPPRDGGPLPHRRAAESATAGRCCSSATSSRRSSASRTAISCSGTAPRSGTARWPPRRTDELIRLMVGRPVDQIFPKADVGVGARPCASKASRIRPNSTDISFAVRRGEILGVYGLVGSGRSEVMQAVFGLTAPSARPRLRRRRAVAIRRPADADPRRHRLRAGGPAGTGRGPEDFDRREHRPAVASRVSRARLPRPQPRVRSGAALRRRLAYPHGRTRPAGRGRFPAATSRRS